jgi:hypothetical protein
MIASRLAIRVSLLILVATLALMSATRVGAVWLDRYGDLAPTDTPLTPTAPAPCVSLAQQPERAHLSAGGGRYASDEAAAAILTHLAAHL